MEFNESSAQRRAALHSFIGFGFGTLWDVREQVWQSAYPGFDPGNTRQKHPGVMVSEVPPNGWSPTVTMMIGTSKKRCSFAVAVEDVYNCEPNRKTHFSSIPPLQLPIGVLTEKLRIPSGSEKNKMMSVHAATRLGKSVSKEEGEALRRLLRRNPWMNKEDRK